MPKDQERAHSTEGTDCWCQPRVEAYGDAGPHEVRPKGTRTSWDPDASPEDDEDEDG